MKHIRPIDGHLHMKQEKGGEKKLKEGMPKKGIKIHYDNNKYRLL